MTTPMSPSASNLGVHHRRSTRATSRSSSPKPCRVGTPDDYTKKIALYAKQRSNTLYAGVHYERLASFLRKPFEAPSRSSSPGQYIPPFDFASLYTFHGDGHVEFCQPECPDELQKHAGAGRNGLLFFLGQPSPEWLAHAGTAYHIDPEFYHRHLDFLYTLGREDYFSHPSLVTASRHIIQLNYMTIGKFRSQLQHSNQEHLDALRHSITSEMGEYLTTISKRITTSSPLFESIVRSYHILDADHFAIKQQVSICFTQIEKAWTVVIWLDTGKPLAADQPGPWSESLRINQANHRETFLPWIQTIPFAALHAKSLAVTQGRRPVGEMEQSASLIHLDYGKALDKQLMAEDPFYALHEIFSLCAVSEVQFLNVLETKIAADAALELGHDMNVSPANMMYFQSLLDSHADMLRGNIESIKYQEEALWPQPQDSVLRKKSSAARRSLLQDYEALLTRTLILSDRCKSRLTILMNRAGIVEANKSIQQTQEVTKLTRLAFVFTPLSFVATFFGMNLGPFTEITNAYGLWLYFAVSAPLVALLLVSMTWSMSELFLKLARAEKGKKKFV
ncbi:hypothetical protein GQ43DRAFT_427866 [Delitschia confertaspora ATCC 74209]|uniref:CorA-like protein n=1 Tax=Delitschia confertaspora ATCC 74209 TaxID=1513339 RepID=A0A9P4JWI5_9PLEO|nr:hypothetical protein GQ43DRAFT_427866 [Delitschia confertaspora ATCC 74209]